MADRSGGKSARARDKALFIYYGDSPNFTDCTTNSQTGANMIGLGDLRYDTSQYPEGPSTTPTRTPRR